MAVTKWKVGDTVRLKSGGPVMTVTNVAKDEQDLVWVSWFDSAGNPFEGSYPEEALEESKP
jgi:uncharacterized protein YodC (DUF2158 family)